MDELTYLQNALIGMGITSPGKDRLDTAYTAILNRQLLYTKAATYDIKYPEHMAKQLIPVSHEIPPGAKTWSYEQWDQFGIAKIISNYADDLPMVDVIADEFISGTQRIGVGYEYSIDDLQSDAMTGRRVINRRAMVARRATEERFEVYGAIGNLTAGLAGILNHPNVSLISAVTGTWATATALQMLADLNALANGVVNANSGIWRPDTVVLSGPLYRRIATEPMLDNTARTVLQTFVDNHPYITNVFEWEQCNLADAEGDGPRALCYKRTPEVLTYEIPQEFQQLPPQAINLAFKIPCHAKVAGVALYYPLAAGYMDGL
ncbi:MAG: major capsid family protein [Planctomycetota bacterium]|jgi:hypothetical protein